MSFSYTLTAPATPYYSGAIAAIDAPPATIALGGIEYPIDLPKYRHRGLPSFRDGVVQSGEPSDQLFDSQGAWWRYRFNWNHGAGQAVTDLERDSDAARFHASRGIDPWEKYEACLLPSTTQKLVVAASASYMVATATHLYVSDGTGVKRTADLSGVPTWSSITGMAVEQVTGMTTDGTDAYIATTGNIYKVTVGGVAAALVQGTPTAPTNSFGNIAFVANKLLIADGDLLREVKNTTLDTIYDHYQDSFVWSTIFQVGSRIYVGGYAGNRSELYTTIVTDTTALAVSSEAASFFAGELLQGALSYGGSVILTTSKGVRFASLGSDGTLQYGPLIEAPGNSKCVAAEGRFAWFGWQTFPDAGCGVGRLALDTFVDTLQPAYATDVFTENVTADVVALARFGGRTVFVVSANGVYATQPGTFVGEGYLDIGEIYFGTVEDKSIAEIRVRTSVLAAGESVELIITDAELGTELATGSTTTLGTVGVAVNAEGAIVNRISGRILIRGNGTSGPCIRQWRGRAYPIGPPMQEWFVPIILHSTDIVGEGQGQHRSYNVWEEVARIKAFWETREVITYQEGTHAYRVRIENYEWMPHDWTDDSDWFDGILTVRLLSI